MHTIPDTITRWVGNSICISDVAGFGLSPVTSITTFQPFFLSFNLPYNAMMLQVDGLKGFKVHNARANRDPFCLCGGKSHTKKFFITAQDIGKLPIFAQAEGVTQQYSHSLYICPKDNEVYSSTVNLPLPADMVSDSARGDVTVIGDIMGPALSNLDGLVRMPTGCGEQNMVGFTPNIYVLKYLTATSRLDEATQDKATSFMETGYQRELKYRHADGSFSAFGERGNKAGSTWLTAFVVKSFAQAKPYIFIDQDDLDMSIRGQVFSSYLKGGLGKEENEAALSAYVLIALLQAGLETEGMEASIAIECINRELQQKPEIDTYTLALAAYANTLYDPSSTVKHWKRQGEQPKPVNSWYYYSAPSAEVEMTAYALLATLAYYGNESLTMGQPIAFWLSNQQSAFGGYSSTQANVRYNKVPSKLGIDDPKFHLKVEPRLYQHNRNKCERRTLHISFGVRDDDSFSAGMTMLTLRMVTGWSVIPDSLRELRSKFPILGIERHEVDEKEGLINFYLDELDTRRRRFTLDVQQNKDLAVSNPKPAEVQIYQYYERVYKSHAGRNKKYSLKIKADLRPHKKLRDINKFANYRMDEGCRCALLEPPMRTVLILTKAANLQGTTLMMDSQTYVFNLRKDRTLERKARRAQRRFVVKVMAYSCSCDTVAVKVMVYGCSCSTVAAKVMVYGWSCNTVVVKVMAYSCSCDTVAVKVMVYGCSCSTVAAKVMVYG
nr:hypothetical protein BaRGS_035212 [Batillaria attramentaria]